MPRVPPCLIHFITLIVFRKEYKSWNSSLYNFLHTPGTLFLDMRDRVSHLYKPTGKIIIPYMLVSFFFFLCPCSELENMPCTKWQQTFPEFNLILISLWMGFWFVTVLLKYLNYATISKNILAVVCCYFIPRLLIRHEHNTEFSQQLLFKQSS
jgi:hypothetical protein